MNRSTLARCTALALSLAVSAVAGAGTLEPYSGAQTPAAETFEDLRGERHSVVDHEGSVVLVNFWASWCGPCITEIPSLRTLNDQMAGEPFRILAVNVKEGPFEVHKFTRLVEMPFPILLDEDGAGFEAWGGVVLPTSYLVDRQGQIRFRVQGPLDWASDDAVETVRGLLAPPEG